MRGSTLAIGLVLGTMATSAGSAAADGPEPAPEHADDSSRPPVPRWYGWQTLIADAADVGVWVLAFKTSGSGSAALLGLGMIGFFVPAPIIHGQHRESGRAAASIAMRLVLPIFGSLVGLAAARCPPPPPQPGWFDGFDCLSAQLDGVGYGLAGGAALASILDATLLAWKRPGDLTFAATAAPLPRVTWLPSVSVARDAERRAMPTLGISGSF